MGERTLWPDGWVAIDASADRKAFQDELRREAPGAHVLSGRAVTLLGRREGRDDFLFELEDGRVAQVHLTWRVETSPEWPWTELYGSFEAWGALPPDER